MASIGALEQLRLFTVDARPYPPYLRIAPGKSQSQVNRRCEEFPGCPRIHVKRRLMRERDEKAVAVPRHHYLAVHALIGSGIRYVWYDVTDLRNIFERGPAVFTAYGSRDLAPQHPTLIGIEHHNRAFTGCRQHQHCGHVAMIPAVVEKPKILLFTRAKPTEPHELLPYFLAPQLRPKHAAHRLRREREFGSIATQRAHELRAEQRKIGGSRPESRRCHFGIDMIAPFNLGAVEGVPPGSAFGARGRRGLFVG